MKFLNRFSKNPENTKAQNAETANNQWEASSRNDFETQTRLAAAERQNTERQQAQQERQERKLMGCFLSSTAVLEEPDIQIPDDARDAVYKALASHEIDDTRKSSVIQEIVTPYHRDPEKAMDSLNSKHELRILASMSGTGFDYWESASIFDLQNVLRQYPTPYELAADEADFLEDIRANNSPQKYAQYQEAMENFKQKVYGKRYEYYKAMESLQQKADHAAAMEDTRTKVLKSYNTSPANTPPRSPEIAYHPIEIRSLTSREQQKILKASKLDGDQFIYNGTSYELSAASLENFGLEPKFEFQLDNAKINLSDPYQVDGHAAITAYVQTEHGINVCSYYRSNSQGVWRYLPDYVSDPHDPNSAVEWLGKGYDEDSLNLPSETQAVLETISNNRQSVSIHPLNAEFAFVGTAKRYNSKDEYRQHMMNHTLQGRHYNEVNSTPTVNLGHISYNKATPETLDLSGPESPDFNKINDPMTTSTSLYGQVNVEHVPSENGQLQYTFNSNSQGQVWLGGIEIKNAPISSSGLRTEWASTGDYGTPLYEYAQQSDGYGDPNDNRGHYTNMWKNYLSRMPLIRRYLATRSQ